jgi:hypothetical protein
MPWNHLRPLQGGVHISTINAGKLYLVNSIQLQMWHHVAKQACLGMHTAHFVFGREAGQQLWFVSGFFWLLDASDACWNPASRCPMYVVADIDAGKPACATGVPADICHQYCAEKYFLLVSRYKTRGRHLAETCAGTSFQIALGDEQT